MGRGYMRSCSPKAVENASFNGGSEALKQLHSLTGSSMWLTEW
jgi:hypothetical protein